MKVEVYDLDNEIVFFVDDDFLGMIECNLGVVSKLCIWCEVYLMSDY